MDVPNPCLQLLVNLAHPWISVLPALDLGAP